MTNILIMLSRRGETDVLLVISVATAGDPLLKTKSNSSGKYIHKDTYTTHTHFIHT